MVDERSQGRKQCYYVVKRAIDIIAAALGLFIFLPLMLLVGILIVATDRTPVFYREYRVGRNGRLFPIYKFRTLAVANTSISSVAPEDDPRITPVGLWLRRWRLDEFPQLCNVLVGHMSLVGPRPMPPSHAAALPAEQLDILLRVRPGVTDAAAIYFLAEDAVLAGCDNAEALYLARFLPVKTHMQIESLRHWSLTGDLLTVFRTLALLWSPQARRDSALAMRKLLTGEEER